MLPNLKIAILAFISTIGLVFAVAASTAAQGDSGRPDYCNQYPTLNTAQGAAKRAQKGWNADKVKISRSAQERVRIQSHCAPSQDGREHVRKVIEKARADYKHAKKKAAAKALYDKITSSPGQARLAVLRQCESTNRYNDPAAPAGAYGMLQGWALSLTYYTDEMRKYFGDPPTPPYLATPEQQDILASLLYQHGGSWECPF